MALFTPFMLLSADIGPNPRGLGTHFCKVGGERLAVIARGEACSNQLGQVHCRVRRTVSEELSVGEVFLGGGVADSCRVVAGAFVHCTSELCPVDDFTGVRHVVGAVFSAGKEQVQGSCCQVLGEGRAAPLVGDHGRVDTALSQGCHGANEVLAGANNPAGAQGVVLTPCGGGNLTGSLGCAVDAQRCQGVILRVFLAQGNRQRRSRWIREPAAG